MRSKGMRKLPFVALLVVMAVPVALTAQAGDKILKPADMQKLVPASVYYDGQSAPTQLRNSGGVKFADGHYVLATLVDTSGYSTALGQVPGVLNCGGAGEGRRPEPGGRRLWFRIRER